MWWCPYTEYVEKEVKKVVGKPMEEKTVFERLELLRRNASFLPKPKEVIDDRFFIRKTVGGTR